MQGVIWGIRGSRSPDILGARASTAILEKAEERRNKTSEGDEWPEDSNCCAEGNVHEAIGNPGEAVKAVAGKRGSSGKGKEQRSRSEAGVNEIVQPADLAADRLMTQCHVHGQRQNTQQQNNGDRRHGRAGVGISF